jgi:hypothetical protein
MNRPPQSDFALGNPLTVMLAVGGTLYVALLWGSQGEHPQEPISWIFPVAGIALSRAALMARRRVAAYTANKRAWDEAAGITPQEQALARRNAPRPLHTRIDRAVGVVVVWLIAAGWLVLHADDANSPYFPYVASGFGLANAWGLGLAVRRTARGVLRTSSARAPARGRGGKDIVRVCLPVPHSSPGIRQITAALPAYCHQLLQRQSSATPRHSASSR